MDEIRKALLDRRLSIADNISKGRKADPIGTVRNGRKKIAEGKWVPLSESRERGKGDAGKKRAIKAVKDLESAISVRQRAIDSRKNSVMGASHFKEEISEHKSKISELKKKLTVARRVLANVGKV